MTYVAFKNKQFFLAYDVCCLQKQTIFSNCIAMRDKEKYKEKRNLKRSYKVKAHTLIIVSTSRKGIFAVNVNP